MIFYLVMIQEYTNLKLSVFNHYGAEKQFRRFHIHLLRGFTFQDPAKQVHAPLTLHTSALALEDFVNAALIRFM